MRKRPDAVEVLDPAAEVQDRDAWLWRWLAVGVVAVHLVCLLAALPNYRASVDSAYHTALGRQFGIHGFYFFDRIHYAPAHRPNLQGPVVHVMIGAIGRLLGGDGDHYVFAKALLGVLCWLSGGATIYYFARQRGGDLAALLALAVLTGGVNTGTTLSMNLPVFWMFLATAWAIHFFLNRQLAATLACASLACYFHLGGFATAPIGLITAAVCRGQLWSERRNLRELAISLVGTAMMTSPYWWHVLRWRSYYIGVKSDTAWWIDPLVDVLWIAGLAWALRMPRRNAFLIAWAAAPAIWIVQDASRFILISALPGAVLGGIILAAWLQRWQSVRWRRMATGLLLYVATVFPLGIPSLGGEVFWLARSFPLFLDWAEMKADAKVIQEHGLNTKIVQGYTSYVVSAVSVFTSIEGEKGHWIEVQPPVDPSDELGVAEKTYVVALPPDDDQLAVWQEKGWLRTYGGGRWSAVVQFVSRPTLEDALQAHGETFARDAQWLADHGEHNTMGNFLAVAFDATELPRRRAARGEARSRATRMQLAQLLHAFALETIDARRARLARDDARALGWIAALQGDEMAMDYRSAEVHAQFRDDLAQLAAAAERREGVDPALEQLLGQYLNGIRGGLMPNKSRP